MDFWKFVVLAVLAETFIEVLKWVFEKDLNAWRIGAFIFGLLITPLTGLDLFATIGLPLSIPFMGEIGVIIGMVIGWILTGVFVSRGSAVVHDLLETISKVKDSVSKIPNLPP